MPKDLEHLSLAGEAHQAFDALGVDCQPTQHVWCSCHSSESWQQRDVVCRTFILPEDLEHFLEPEKAQQAFDILDVDGDGQVTLHNIRDAVVTIYQVQQLAALSLTSAPARCLFLMDVGWGVWLAVCFFAACANHMHQVGAVSDEQTNELPMWSLLVCCVVLLLVSSLAFSIMHCAPLNFALDTCPECSLYAAHSCWVC